MQVELIFDKDCPNVEEARAQLQRAFRRIERRPQWQEWDRSDPTSPEYARKYGSPTVLVGGNDVAGMLPTDDADCCRLYHNATGRFAGVPTVEQIVQALSAAGERDNPANRGASGGTAGRWMTSLGVVPAVAAALLPSITCPACWPAYGALLSSLGIGFLPTSQYILPLTLGGVAFALLMFVWQARRRRRYGPLMLATLGACVLLVGRFVFPVQSLLYGGVSVLVAASLWDAWPTGRRLASGSELSRRKCPACPSSAATNEPNRQSPPLTPDLSPGRRIRISGQK